MPGSPLHLIQRFVDVATSAPLSLSERGEVSARLTAEQADRFFDQDPPDQRHGYEAAESILADGRFSVDVVVAAMLHDVGKRHARLGLIGRSLASLAILLRLPLPRRARWYRDHGELGAAELEDIGAPALAIDFTRHHHGERPDTIDSDIWLALVEADRPAKPWSRYRRRITSSGT